MRGDEQRGWYALEGEGTEMGETEGVGKDKGWKALRSHGLALWYLLRVCLLGRDVGTACIRALAAVRRVGFIGKLGSGRGYV